MLIFKEQLSPIPNESSCLRTYMVKQGDTMHGIAKDFNIPLETLVRINPQITDPNLLYPNQTICLPPPFPYPRESIHQVKPGDTLFEIARTYNISLNVLIAANRQISQPNRIFPGEVLHIPRSRYIHKGEATFFDADRSQGDFCRLPSPQYHVAALHPKTLNDSRMCGAYIEVVNSRNGKFVRVLVISSIGIAKPEDVDLDRAAFREIADPREGRVPIEWRVVPLEFKPCDRNRIEYYTLPGRPGWKQYSVQIRNHLYPIDTLEYWNEETGRFVEVQRQIHTQTRRVLNNFIVPELEKYTFRLTSYLEEENKESIIDEGIVLKRGESVSGDAQFTLLENSPCLMR